MSIMGFFYFLLIKIFGYKKPSKVKKFKAEFINMSDIRVSWTLPTVTPRQRPIQHTEISVRVDPSFPWTVQDTVDVGAVPQEILFVDVAPGVQYFQAVVVDVDGVRSTAVETSADAPFDAPGAVTGFTAAIEG